MRPTSATTNLASVVTVRGLTKSYDGRKVVDGLDMDVEPGQVVGLLGANGAGKTTTVEILQGLRRPDAGRVRVLGLDPVADAGRLRPHIGAQLQSSGLPDRLRVEEALRLFSGPGAVPHTELLSQFGLTHLRRSAFAGLSGGERQRLFLVLALLNRPRLVILDELTQGLDPAARREVWSAVLQLRDAGTTVLLVTHELDEAERLCDAVIVMCDGRVLDQGAPSEVVARQVRQVRIQFSLPGTRSSVTRAVEELRHLPGVVSATHHTRGDTVVVSGDREAIAQVGAWLLATGQPVPDDIRVETPDLEAAVVALLDRDRSVAYSEAVS